MRAVGTPADTVEPATTGNAAADGEGAADGSVVGRAGGVSVSDWGWDGASPTMAGTLDTMANMIRR